MSLEEYEPNREFVGRNFNAGEVIQLVLKSPTTGRWLPFQYVQMVMMHELAHCKQMNHSKAFWAVRNVYADQMKLLFAQSFTGEGLWGRGASLKTGTFEANTALASENLPEHLCGGTFRSRRRKRKATSRLSYQERKQRRIEKKFGKDGVALGEDEDAKAMLKKGKRTAAKPRVAGSKRGRELRAAAALARFDQQKPAAEKKQQDAASIGRDGDAETTSDSDTCSDGEGGNEDGMSTALDIDGRDLRDSKGHRMVRVCEDEDSGDHDAQRELRELQSSLTSIRTTESSPSHTKAFLDVEPKRERRDRGIENEPIKTSAKPSGVCSMCSYDNGTGVITCGV